MTFFALPLIVFSPSTDKKTFCYGAQGLPRIQYYIVGSFACIGGGLFGLDISSMSGVLTVSATTHSFAIDGDRLESEE
ncbi:hypothetical protein MPER_05356, partial [Moniliophthora perniciosa FA553]